MTPPMSWMRSVVLPAPLHTAEPARRSKPGEKMTKLPAKRAATLRAKTSETERTGGHHVPPALLWMTPSISPTMTTARPLSLASKIFCSNVCQKGGFQHDWFRGIGLTLGSAAADPQGSVLKADWVTPPTT